MKTITFYSYKGGVGRSLALSNIAIRLAQLHKKVCVIDFDLDAPGLRFKFPDYTLSRPIEKGIVDYIYNYSSHGIVPSTVSDYIVELSPNNVQSGPISFFSAGNIESDDYWKKLAMIRWADLFYGEKAKGIRFFLDLKAKIEKEIKPDILLIDSRTGITDISGITLRLFADEIVVLAVNNKENFFGTKKIMKSLLNPAQPLGKMPKIHFVLTRLPFSDTPQDKEKEFSLLQEKSEEFQEALNLTEFEILTIHSDRRLEEKERQLIGISYNDKAASIANDYLKLFNLLTKDVLSPEEMERFQNWKLAELEFSAALLETDLAKKLIRLNQAIALNDRYFQFHQERGNTNWKLGRYTEGIVDFQKVLSLYPHNQYANYVLGILYYNLLDYETAISYFDRISSIPEVVSLKTIIFTEQGKFDEAFVLLNEALEQNPGEAGLYNSRADLLRRVKKFPEAYQDIYKAIEMAPNEALYFATLAEISADSGNLEGFYLNLTVALSKGLSAASLASAISVYEPFYEQKRFIDLLSKYQLRVEDLTKHGRHIKISAS